MSENEKKASIEADVQRKRDEYIERKKKFEGKAINLSEQILKGIVYEEDYYVRLVNGDVGLIVIRPLAEGEVVGLIDDIGLEVLENIGKSTFSQKDYDFFWSVVSQSTGLPKDLIKKTFAIGESAMMATRILEISGFTEGTTEEVENF